MGAGQATEHSVRGNLVAFGRAETSQVLAAAKRYKTCFFRRRRGNRQSGLHEVQSALISGTVSSSFLPYSLFSCPSLLHDFMVSHLGLFNRLHHEFQNQSFSRSSIKSFNDPDLDFP